MSHSKSRSLSMSPLILACDDCKNNDQELKEVSACSDYHTGDGMCCFKNICINYCSYKCLQCSSINKINIEDSFDNFYDAFICWKCYSVNEVNVKFYGDLKETCRRYCECGIHERTHFNVNGLESDTIFEELQE